MPHNSRRTTLWTFVVTSIALVMVTLDNLVVTTALPVIKRELNASLESLEWTVNAYTLTFAVFLLTGAALGDRFGRRRMFLVGLVIFTGASVAAALCAQRGSACRRPRDSGTRRGVGDAPDADTLVGCRSRREAGRRVRYRRLGCRLGSACRRRNRARVGVAVDLLDQRSDRSHPSSHRLAPSGRKPRTERAA